MATTMTAKCLVIVAAAAAESSICSHPRLAGATIIGLAVVAAPRSRMRVNAEEGTVATRVLEASALQPFCAQ